MSVFTSLCVPPMNITSVIKSAAQVVAVVRRAKSRVMAALAIMVVKVGFVFMYLQVLLLCRKVSRLADRLPNCRSKKTINRVCLEC